MLAETLALALVLSSPGTPRARPAIELSPDNASRARRGLLPRKIAKTRPPPRGRRIVLVPQVPTWLGEPADPGEAPEATGAVAELAVVANPEPVIVLARAVVPAGERPPEALRASLEGAEVTLLFVRRVDRDVAVHAALAEPEVQVVLLRSPARAVPP